MFQIRSLAGNSLPSKSAFCFVSSLLAIIGLNFIGGFSSENCHNTWKPDNYLSLVTTIIIIKNEPSLKAELAKKADHSFARKHIEMFTLNNIQNHTWQKLNNLLLH